MAERKVTRGLRRSIRTLQRLEHYAIRRNAIMATEHEYLVEGIHQLRRSEAIFSHIAPPHPLTLIYHQLRRAADDPTPR